MKRVLVVEDDLPIRALLVDFLCCEGYVVSEAASGMDALREMEHVHPDVIVLDVMMPDMDGRAFAVACHQRMRAQQVPILLVSAAPQLWQTANQLRRFGVRGFVSKPFDLDILIAAVDGLAERADVLAGVG
jgi:two-component system OmpR family response regulator